MIPEGIKVYGSGRQRYKPGEVVPAHLLTKKVKEVIDKKGAAFADRKAKAVTARKVDEEKRQKAVKDRRAKKAADKKKLLSSPVENKAPEKVEDTPSTYGNAASKEK